MHCPLVTFFGMPRRTFLNICLGDGWYQTSEIKSTSAGLIDIRHGWHVVIFCDCRLRRDAGSTLAELLLVSAATRILPFAYSFVQVTQQSDSPIVETACQ